MDAPTPSPTTLPEPQEPTSVSAPNPVPRRSRRRRIVAAGLAGTVAIAGLGAIGLHDRDDASAASARNDRTVADLIVAADDDLGDLTLDDLADRLAELGLEVTVGPASGAAATETPTDSDAVLGDPEPAEGSDEPAESSDGADPFAGMSDAEIDALSDDEFFSMLEEAGWTIDDEGWIVPEGEATADGESVKIRMEEVGKARKEYAETTTEAINILKSAGVAPEIALNFLTRVGDQDALVTASRNSETAILQLAPATGSNAAEIVGLMNVLERDGKGANKA